FEELSQKFLEEFSQQKRYAKDPIEIHGIKRRHNKGLQAFIDRFISESSHIKGVPLVLRISAFMHGHGHPELAKKLNDKIPKTVDEMFERVKAFIRGEVAAGSTEMVRPSQGDKGYIRPTWTGGPEKARNRGDPREGSQHQRLLSVKKANRGSCSLGEVGTSGERHSSEQPAKDHVDNRLKTVIDKSYAGKHGGICMGRIRKNVCSTIRHGASTKDIPLRRTSALKRYDPYTRRKTSIERKGVLMDKRRNDQKGSAPRHVPLSEGRGRDSIDNGISVQMFPMTSEGIQPNKNDRG
ncbi:hypothetical protein Tco_1396671, partial [Tanacetum coccineum]